MKPTRRISNLLLAFAISAQACSVFAAEVDFSGHWTIDLRSPQERKQKVECGGADFTLTQTGEKISGSHSYATPRCGRLNEGGDETVKGVVVGSTAVLVVTSGRNGGMVLGKAKRQGNKLHWTSLEDLTAGDPQGDSLILGQGVLTLDTAAHK